jgi:hypothetical protein
MPPPLEREDSRYKNRNRVNALQITKWFFIPIKAAMILITF